MGVLNFSLIFFIGEKMKIFKQNFIYTLIFVLSAQGIHAYDEGDIVVRAGFSKITPQSSNGDVVNVGSKSNATAAISYFFSERISAEVLLGLPFEHSVFTKAGDKVGKAKHLPPTFLIQYHLDSIGKLSPYVGIGLNHTFFLSEKATGALAGSKLDITSSTGFVAQLGLDYELKTNLIVNLDIRKHQINPSAILRGTDGSTVKFDVPLDPVTVGLGIVFKF